MENPEPVTDATVGKNVTYLRGSRPQSEIAEGMRKKGFKWSQTTVWEIEKGKRTLKFLEAIALAEVLETRIHILEHVADDFFVERNALKALREIEDASDRALDAAVEFDKARSILKTWVSQMHDDPQTFKAESMYRQHADRTLLESLRRSATRRGNAAQRELQMVEGEISNEWLLRTGPRGENQGDPREESETK